ncbi:hypothetical protein D9615_003865 [Tricholomella constricta]|uniref:PAN2-PAN3 deadenylation complex catalytic subunit PAN2 n=1 Tax=Tricholomella constricta TaxID=117010 RepID=A0A8H5M4P2_9AGAR|nr:hypothetical protein D9615_003865 [Tricholomella constricta]
MSTSYQEIMPITLSGYPQPVTALSFDPVSDILWAGSNSGDVTGCYGTRGVRGVSFPVGGSLAVKKIIAGENHVRATGVSGEGLGSWTKGGMNKWFFRCDQQTHLFVPFDLSKKYYRHTTNISTFSNTPNTNVVAASTVDMELLYINSVTGTTIRHISTPSMITHIQSSPSMLLSGSLDGYLRTHDTRASSSRAGGAESLVKAHSSGFQGLETTGNFAFTIGLGERQARPFPDPLVKVYDLRTMRSLPPIPFSSGPAFIHVLPKRPSTIAVISNQGLINIVDILNPAAASEFYQLDLTSYITSCSISATAAYMAFGDAEGVIHLLTQAEDVTGVPFNGFDGQPIEWPDTPALLPKIDWTETTALNTVGLPLYDTQLLSAWTPHLLSSTALYPPPPKIPPQLLNTMKVNPVTPIFDYSDSDVPRMYRHVEIEYSKFGVEDFDFGFYNETEYSGLETHILNSYTNPVLQVMHYSPPIRTLAKSHITTSCLREHCLLCELGFVMCMLEDARGINCQSSNFCKTVGVLAQASNAIELIDYGRDSAEVDYAHKIQIFHRFLIDHLSSEGNTFPNNPFLLTKSLSQSIPHSLSAAPVTQLLGINGKNLITCSSCRAVREKDNMTHVVDLTYPRKGPSNEPPPPMDFISILRHSLLRQITHKATCQRCKHFANFVSRRSISSRDLPPILAINACIYNDDNLNLWLDVRGQTFLNPRIELHGQVDGINDPIGTLYSIRSLVVQIMSKDKHSHLVAIVKVPEAEGKDDLRSPWFLFNDFVVRNISEEEALSFPDKWKVPAIIYYERSDLHEVLDYSGLPNGIDETILSHDTSISLSRDPRFIKHEVLRPEELPRPGTLVAIDAEFVLMQQEEIEFRSDGTNKVLRPARLSLARVSVLRGDGPKQGVPFIDDHIHTSEVIVDYLTEFSGIKFGDLDPHISRHTLTPLKLVYKKLRLLVDRGCRFIGHGLSKDFRIINIFVPPEQVIDTVDLYFLKSRQRRLSLRFLSWFVLHEHIQTDTHDSIEDARSALNLYKAYHELKEADIFDQKLEELYSEGRRYNFKPPPALDSTKTLAEERAGSPGFSVSQAKNINLPGNLHSYSSNWHR